MIRQRLYNPAQLTPDELKASFVARKGTLAEMIRLIREQPCGRPCQHMMLIGSRGMGKTTLGLRFLHAVEESPDLAADWQPVPFYEESYGVGNLADFWLAALRHLTRATGDPRWEERADALAQDERDTERLAAYALAALLDFCQASGKRLILFVENLDTVFEQLHDEREVHALRANLIERSDILLVGSANAVFEAIQGYGKPLYEFFRLFMLEGLGQEETLQILKVLADLEDKPEILETLRRESGRLETLRRLTGGNPRLLVLACRLLIESPLGSAFEDLERLIDEQTPYFKARIEELPVQSRKVFHCLAEGWKPMLAREVADAANLNSSHASAQLKQLVEKGYAREIRLQGAKRIRYEVSDRFYNIYYLLRFSRAGRYRLERLVAFLHDLFGPSGMRMMYPATLEALREHGLPTWEVSNWLSILAGYVARDKDFKGREDWLREALNLASNMIGPHAPVIEEISKTFPSQDSSSPSSLIDWIQRGHALFKDRRFADAEAAYRKATGEMPNDATAWTGLGKALFELGRFEDAITALGRIPFVNPNDSVYLRGVTVTALGTKADALTELGRHEEAIAIWERITEYVRVNDPADLRQGAASSLIFKGLALTELGRHEEAIAIWERITEYVRVNDPADLRQGAALILMTKGFSLSELDRRDEAVTAWEQVAEYVRPDDPIDLRHAAAVALGAKGSILSELECYDEAITAWEQVAEYVRPDDPSERRQLIASGLTRDSGLLYMDGRYREAEAACRNAANIGPTYSEVWLILAETILCQGDEERLPEAEECARRAVELAPKDPSAFHTLSDVLACRGQWTEALDQLENALSIGGDDFQEQNRPGLTESLSRAVATGHGSRVKRIMEEAGLAEPMEPLWHAVREELGEELEPLPAEIRDTVTEIRQEFTEKRR